LVDSLNIGIPRPISSDTFSENNKVYRLIEVHWNIRIETDGTLKTITLFDMIIFAVENNVGKSRRNRKMGRGVCSFKRGQCERDSSACRCHSGSIHSFRSCFHWLMSCDTRRIKNSVCNPVAPPSEHFTTKCRNNSLEV